MFVGLPVWPLNSGNWGEASVRFSQSERLESGLVSECR